MRPLYTIESVARILGAGSSVLNDPGQVVRYLAYDTRKLFQPAESLFFALRSKRNGHDFIPKAIEKGVRHFVVEKAFDIPGHLQSQANWIVVENTWAALQALATHHRQQFSIPVIGITGSNGKTLVKEWLFQLLSYDKKVYRTPKSMNSQLGAAISLWGLNEGHELAIIEAGISEPGEMDNLAAMIRPVIGIFTNIGMAHQEGFESLQAKALEKSKLFNNAQLWIGSVALQSQLSACKTIHENARIWQIHDLQNLGLDDPGTKIEITFDSRRESFWIPFRDMASIENAAHVYVCMRLLGYDTETLNMRLKHLHPVEMRLELKQGHHRRTLIDDSYSNDSHALGIALDFLKQQQQHKTRCLILSDLAESAVSSFESEHLDLVYNTIAKRIQEAEIDVLLSVGPETYKRQGKLGATRHLAYKSMPDLLDEINLQLPADCSVLIKGARIFGFEKISRLLSAQSHQTALEINMATLEHNIRLFRRQLQPGVKIMAMVKAFSYGSGSYEIANLLQFHQIDYLAVAYSDEGKALRDAGIQIPIMVMNPEPAAFEMMESADLEPEIFNFELLREWGHRTSQKPHGLPVKIHLKVDTGMHRLGFQWHELEQLDEVLRKYPHLKIQSVLSHMVASGQTEHDEFSREQIRRLQAFAQELKRRIGYDFIMHIANTEGIARFPEAHLDMVRLGIGMYGLTDRLAGLEPVIRLKTHVSQLHKVAKGETVGYGRKGILHRNSLVATVRVGYADGYDRRFGNGIGEMRIHGENVPTLGDICMDMCMLDVTDLPYVSVGDEVIVLDDFQEAAFKIGTIPYELLVGISQRVRRLYYYGH